MPLSTSAPAKSPTCGCCSLWVEHMRKEGFTVEVEDLPIAYLPGNSLRVRVRVVGDIARA